MLLVVFYVDDFVKIVESYLFTTLVLVGKCNNPDTQIHHNFTYIIRTLLDTVCVCEIFIL